MEEPLIVGRQRLNAADRFLLAVDRTLRHLGGPGFETQTCLCLAGRVDRQRLEAGLAKLVQRLPVALSRLVESSDQGGPAWQFQPGRKCTLHEANLASPEPHALWDHAGQLFSAPCDPAEVDPLRFHLLHRPDGRDVFLLSYNHALLDHNGAVHVLQQVHRLAAGETLDPLPPVPRWRDPIWHYMRRFPRARRHAATKMAEQWRKTLRGGAIHLGHSTMGNTGPVSYRLATRRLEVDQTSALQKLVVRTCGVPSLSMAILGCVFRAIGRLATGEGAKGRYFNADIGVDLGLKRTCGQTLQNLTSVVPIRVGREEVQERDPLWRLLSAQFRERLGADFDLGVLGLSSVFGRRPRQAQWAIELLMRYCLSLWFGYFGPMDSLGTEFCGAGIEEVFSAGPSWPPVGLTLLGNQYRGRLHLQASYIPECVPEALANAFLDAVVADLLAGT